MSIIHKPYLLALLALPLMAARENLKIDLPAGAIESRWRDALSNQKQGQTEVTIKTGRADVVTSNEVFELDQPGNWKEGMGQVLVYSQEMGLVPVLALISTNSGTNEINTRDSDRFDLAEKYCATNGVRLLVLFPLHPAQSPISKPIPN